MNISQTRLARLFFLLLLSTMLFSLGACERQDREAVDWYKNFFLEAAKDEDNSRRMFSIWFGGDRLAFTNEIWIGGSQDEAKKWVNRVDTLLTGYKESKLPTADFVFELVADQATFDTLSSHLTDLRDQYPETFKITFLDDVPAANMPPKEVIDHARFGNPAIASDALRLWYLQDTKFSTNVYLDVDTFLDKTSNLSRYGDYKIFGREVEPSAIYHPHASSDYLIEKRAPKSKIDNIKKTGLSRYEHNARLLNHYKKRGDFAVKTGEQGFSDYWTAVSDLVDYQIKAGDRMIDLVAATIATFGPSLWVDSSLGADPDVKENTAMKDEIVSAQAWKEGGAIPIDVKRLTANTLDSLEIIKSFDTAALAPQKKRLTEIVLALNLFGWDHKYFSRFPGSTINLHLVKRATELWQEAESIITRHLGEDKIEGLKKELKASTGGIFLSFVAIGK